VVSHIRSPKSPRAGQTRTCLLTRDSAPRGGVNCSPAECRAGLQGGDFRRVHGGILADGGDGFQRHVTTSDRPFVVLLQHQRSDKTSDGGLIRKDTYDIGAALDLFVEALKRIGRMDLPLVGLRESLVRQYVVFGAQHQLG